MNSNRVLNNSDSLNVSFTTTANYNADDVYLFQLRFKEKVLFTDQLKFNVSSTENYSVDASSFPVVNGGLFTVALYRYTEAFY